MQKNNELIHFSNSYDPFGLQQESTTETIKVSATVETNKSIDFTEELSKENSKVYSLNQSSNRKITINEFLYETNISQRKG